MPDIITKSSPVIYARDHKGQTRNWQYIVRGDSWCTITGLIDGKQTQSKWKTVKGKRNTTAEEQALLDAESALRRNLKTDYHESRDTLHEPKYFAPMLAQSFKKYETEGWSSPKLDGHRYIATRKGVFSRNGEPIYTTPHIRSELRDIFFQSPHLVIDGELYNHEYHDRFEELSGMISTKNVTDRILAESREVLQFHVFDMYDQRDPTALKHERLQMMNHYVGDFEFTQLVPFSYVDSEATLDFLYHRYLREGYEGQMFNRYDSVYELSPLDYRSSGLLKRKETQSKEFLIKAVHEGSGNWGGVAKTVTVDLGDGKECEATLKGTRGYAAKVLENATSIIDTWATVEFFGYTADGLLRFPRVRVIDRKDLKL